MGDSEGKNRYGGSGEGEGEGKGECEGARSRYGRAYVSEVDRHCVRV